MNHDQPIWPGKPYPLGANWDGEGVNFALFSENGTGVTLCLFDPEEEKEVGRIKFTEKYRSGMARLPSGNQTWSALWI